MRTASGSDPGFVATYRVRFDEAGPDGGLRASGLLRYTQDLAAQHSEALGYDRTWYAARGLTWLVRTAELDLLGAMPYASVLTGTTRVMGFRRVWSRRESTFELGGEVVAVVRIDWVLLDVRGAPARVPASFETIFPTARSSTPLQLLRVAVGEVPATAARRTIAVRPQELDPLGHVNNATYADWLEEAVVATADDMGANAVGSLPRRVRLEYARPAAPGDRLETAVWPDAGGWSCRIGRAHDGAELLRARVEPMSESIPGPR